MTIYVVRSGDSLWTISQRFGVSIERISLVNKLYELPYLVVGQALVIPTQERAYRVVAGDSLWSISRKFNVSIESIVELNRITNPALIVPGTILRIPELSKNFGNIYTNGYIEPSTNERDIGILNEVSRYLTFVSPFSYQVNPDGSLIPLNDTTILSTARNYRTAGLMVITNFRNGNFDTELGHIILSEPQVQDTLLSNVMSVIQSKGYTGLNVDFERLRPTDRQAYNNFLQKAADTVHSKGYSISTALAPKISGSQEGEWYSAHDYPAHGRIADFVILMTYEWGWSGGPPLPVAPINQVRAVLNYAVTVIPRSKIMMGMPLYGYDWTLPYLPHGAFARRVSPQQAIGIAGRFGARIQYDYTAQSPFINYWDEKGNNHIIWFEDARSARAKYLLENEFKLRGVSYWVLGSDFPQNWAVLNDMFNVLHVI